MTDRVVDRVEIVLRGQEYSFEAEIASSRCVTAADDKRVYCLPCSSPVVERLRSERFFSADHSAYVAPCYAVLRASRPHLVVDGYGVKINPYINPSTSTEDGAETVLRFVKKHIFLIDFDKTIRTCTVSGWRLSLSTEGMVECVMRATFVGSSVSQVVASVCQKGGHS